MTQPFIKFEIGGHLCLIDKQDTDLISDYSWKLRPNSARTDFYVNRNVYGANTPCGATTEDLHRVVLARMAGYPLRSRQLTDHCNDLTLDNRRVNLRLITPTQRDAKHGLRYDNRRAIAACPTIKSRASGRRPSTSVRGSGATWGALTR